MKPARLMKALLTLLGLVVIITGCSRKPRIENLPLPDPQELIARSNLNIKALQDFTGAGLVEISGPEVRGTVAGLRIKSLQPDFLEIKLRGPLGIGLGSLTLAGDRYCVKANSEPLSKSGSISEFEYPLEGNLTIRGDEVRNLFKPLIEVKAYSDSLLIARDPKANQFKLCWSAEGKYYQAWADPYQPLFLRELMISAEGDTLWDKRIRHTKTQSGLYLPGSWSIQIGQAKKAYRVNIELSQVNVNMGLHPDEFIIEADSLHDQDK
jgi:hypothetical protein